MAARRFLRAIDIQTGEIRWELPQTGPANSWGGVLATAGGIVLFCEDGGIFTAADAKTGKRLWQWPAESGLAGLADDIYVRRQTVRRRRRGIEYRVLRFGAVGDLAEAHRMNRRSLVKTLAGTAVAAGFPERASPQKSRIDGGIFKPTWDSLKQYRTPDWFRDAKFGIWAHWTAQCVPEQGDWYARQMYIQGQRQYKYHVETYGHPSKFGFMEIDNLWKAENWEPEALMELYVRPRAQSISCRWPTITTISTTTTRRTTTGTPCASARRKTSSAPGRRSRASTACASASPTTPRTPGTGSRPPMATMPKGPWPASATTHSRAKAATARANGGKASIRSELYTGRACVMPERHSPTIAEAQPGTKANDRNWDEEPPAGNPEFVETWFLRCKDLIDNYEPDLLYFDNTELPLGQAGLDIAAHFYNASIKRHGQLEAVVNSARTSSRSTLAPWCWTSNAAAPTAFCPSPGRPTPASANGTTIATSSSSTDTRPPRQVIQTLVDIVSKNGNLLLNIPLQGRRHHRRRRAPGPRRHWHLDACQWRGDLRHAALHRLRRRRAGRRTARQLQREQRAEPTRLEDIRFTTKGDTLYAIALGWPEDGKLTIQTLAQGRNDYPKTIGRIELLGGKGPLPFRRQPDGLVITLPETRPNEFAYVFRIQAA